MNEQVQLFDPIKAEIQEAKERNSHLHFEYETPAGSKAARSHIYTLRKVKAKIADAHKQAKAEALKVSQTLDAIKRDLTAEVDGMIAVHEQPILEIEQREARAKAELERKAQEERERIERQKAEEMRRREEEIARREAEIRQRELEQQRKEREAQIAKDAEDRAKREAEAAIERERAEAQRLVEKAEREKQAAIQAERDRVERERKYEAARVEAERIAEEKRQANKRHRAKIESESACDMEAKTSVHIDQCREVIEAIKNGEIRNVSINY